MSDIISPLLQWLNAHPELAGLVTFIISAAESVAIIGVIVPGSITMAAIGALAGAGIIPLWATIFWAILGAVVGDGISYWLGHYFKDRLRNLWPFKGNPGLLLKGEAFFHKYGAMSVFIGRFVGPVRALVPVVAGMLGMKPLQFTIANVTSAILWAPAYMLPGILLGVASLELPPDIAIHVILVLFLITLFIIMCIWMIVKLLQLIHQQIEQLQAWFSRHLRKVPYFSYVMALFNPHEKKHHVQMNLAIYFCLVTLLFLILALYVKTVGSAYIGLNDAIYHLFRGIRSPFFDTMMINVTLLGQKQVILPIILVLWAFLLMKKRWRASLHVLALGILAAGCVWFLKNLLQSARPWGIFQSPETLYSFPSGHVTLAVTIYFGIAFFITQGNRLPRAWFFYALAFLLSLSVAISRLYLGAHWATDIIAAALLGTAILLLVIISYLRKTERALIPWQIFLVSLISLMVTFSFYHYRYAAILEKNYAQIEWPIQKISGKDWWQQNIGLSILRVSLFGFPSGRINVEWAGDLEQIRTTLMQEGWSKPPARDFVSTMHRIADISSSQYLPLISPQYLDNKPALVLAKPVEPDKRLLVFRLWNSNRVIKETQTPIWVGIIGIVPRAYSWIFQSHPGEIEIQPELIFGANEKINWQWQVKDVIQRKGPKKIIRQKIMFIKTK